MRALLRLCLWIAAAAWLTACAATHSANDDAGVGDAAAAIDADMLGADLALVERAWSAACERMATCAGAGPLSA